MVSQPEAVAELIVEAATRDLAKSN